MGVGIKILQMKLQLFAKFMKSYKNFRIFYIGFKYWSKFFTYVTKICANLTTYCRKPENYNGTIIFEIDIMKNLSLINLNLCQTWLFHKYWVAVWFVLVCIELSWVNNWIQQDRKNWHFSFYGGKNVNFLNQGCNLNTYPKIIYQLQDCEAPRSCFQSKNFQE